MPHDPSEIIICWFSAQEIIIIISIVLKSVHYKKKKKYILPIICFAYSVSLATC